MQRDISNHVINFYYGKIKFDTDGVARINCGQVSEATGIEVDCWPSQVS